MILARPGTRKAIEFVDDRIERLVSESREFFAKHVIGAEASWDSLAGIVGPLLGVEKVLRELMG